MATVSIPETPTSELDVRVQKQIENARKNLDKNPTYAVDICSGILHRNAGAYEVRDLLHKAFQKTTGGKTSSGFGKLMKSVTRTPFSMKGQTQLKKNPKDALETAEKMIASEPNGVAGYKLLGEAAESLGMIKTAVLAYQEHRNIESDNLECNLALGRALLADDQPKEAIAVADAIVRDHPGNESAAEIIRKASVVITVDKGKYEKGASFRESLADEKKSVELEQAARVVKDEDVQAKIIEAAKEFIKKEPENLDQYRKIINAYRMMEKHELALEWIQKARQTENGKNDPTLERMEMEYTERVKQVSVSEKRAALEADQGNTALKQELLQAEKDLRQTRLKNAQTIVERYPNDYMARFHLGELFMVDENYDAAIKEFQLAQRNPQVRVKAILNTGKAMLQKGMGDLAITQLETAKSEVPLMNDLKKAIIYELAAAYEAAGNNEAAIKELKDIYQADIGYRDVANRINDFYSK